MDKFMSYFRYLKASLWVLYVTVLLLIAYYALQAAVDTALTNLYNGYDAKVVWLLENNKLLNIYISLSLAGLFGWKLWKNHNQVMPNLSSMWLIIESLILLNYNNSWYFAVSGLLGLTYRCLINVGLSLLLAEDILALFKNIFLHKNKPKYLGFTSSQPIEPKRAKTLDPARHELAKTVAGMMMQTEVENEGCAIGIIGDWGSGKTTFTSMLVDELDNNVYYINFNPWSSDSAKNLVTDYFDTLRDELSCHVKSIKKPLKRYANMLADAGLPDYISTVLSDLGSTDSTLSELKEQLNQELLLLDKPVLVVVDDIDRLEADEVFEVMKIIRSTADFKNIFYVVPFDKDYVVSTLTKKGISHASLYLEKIFPIEISLPRISNEDLLEVIKSEIRSMAHHVSKYNSFLDTEAKQYKIIKLLHILLPTYRKAQSFTRLFVTSCNCMMHQNLAFSMRDMFLLKLLQYSDSETYNKLSTNPSTLLKLDYDNDDNVITYTYTHNPQDTTLSTETIDILKELFRYEGKHRNRQLLIEDNYFTYFCLGIPRNTISPQEFEAMVKGSRLEKEKIVKQWCLKRKTGVKKNSTSIYNRFLTYPLSKLDEENFWNYFDALLCWMKYGGFKVETVLDHALYSPKFTFKRTEDFYNKAYSKLKELVANTNNYNTVAQCLKNIYNKENCNPECIKNDAIRALLTHLTKRLLSGRTFDALNVLQDDGNDLHEYVKKGRYMTEPNKYSNILLEIVTEWFSQEEHKSKNNRRAKVLYQKQKQASRTVSLTDNPKQLDEFIKNCFIEEEEKQTSSEQQ